MAEHRRPEIRYSDAPRGTCRWCGDAILYQTGPKTGQVNSRRRWHPACVEVYDASDPREARRRVRKRDRGVCRACGVDTNILRRQIQGRGRAVRLRELGFVPRRSLWELDHRVPLVDGGSHELSNLQTLCVPCHRSKSAQETRERAARGRDAAATHPPEPVVSSGSGADPLASELDRLMERADRVNRRAEGILAGDGDPRVALSASARRPPPA